MSEQRHIQEGAKEIAKLLDNNKTDEVENRLLSDMLNMKPGEFKNLVESVYRHDSKNVGCDLELTFSGKQMKVSVSHPKGAKSEPLANGYDDGKGQWRFNKQDAYDRVFASGKETDYSSSIEQNPQDLLKYLTREALREATAEFTAEQLHSAEGRKKFEELLRSKLPPGATRIEVTPVK